ncbi:hypothetical protein PIROE2DRAFT_15223 [Piromyces sp. E2]|nr:hypothetical protein PIROE2DRAFT_15223 [Piromyces sp. E2]|eukprot:OUM59279.1 hypothetical protein PIROE2DRAFT_15223 [Piromyces sp. E2]
MEFNGIKYEVLYSNQINKKNKSWKDGFMTYFPKGSKAYLYDESNKHIDSSYGIRIGPELDEEMKFDKYVVLPQSILQTNTSNTTQNSEQTNENNVIANNSVDNNKPTVNNNIPIIKKTIKKKENNKIVSNTRSISQLLSLFPSSHNSISKPLPQRTLNNKSSKNDKNTNTMVVDNEYDIEMNTDNTVFNRNNNKNNMNNFDTKKMNVEPPNLNRNSNDDIKEDYGIQEFHSFKNLDNQNINNMNVIKNTNNNASIMKNTKYISNNYNDKQNSSSYNTFQSLNNNNKNNNYSSLNNKTNSYLNQRINNTKSSITNTTTTNNNQIINNTKLNNNNKYNKQNENDRNKYELRFLTSEECLDISDSSLIRNAIIPVNFVGVLKLIHLCFIGSKSNVSEYQETFKKAIIENIQIELSKLAIKYRSMPSLNESSYRSNGINFYADSKKEKSSAYSKDDIWVISINKNFEKNTTFLAKSVFYGPNGNSAVEVEPISKTDIEVSKYLTSNKKPIFHVYAIRTININTEVYYIYKRK